MKFNLCYTNTEDEKREEELNTLDDLVQLVLREKLPVVISVYREKNGSLDISLEVINDWRE